MQPTEFPDLLVSRTEIKMVGVAENDVGAEVFEDVLRNRFHGRNSPDGHEYRGLDNPVWQSDASGAGETILGFDCE